MSNTNSITNSNTNVMKTGWKTVKLGDVADEYRDTYQPTPNEKLAYLGLEHIEQGTLRINGTGKSSDTASTKLKFQPGDILFGKMRPYFRKVVKPKFDGVCSSEISVIRAKEGTDQNFLFYLIANQHFVDRVNATTQGTGMPRAKWQVMSSLEIKIPSLECQKRIGGILSAFDDLIEKNSRRINVLEAIAQLIYKEWFVNFKFPGHEDVKFVDSETKFGEIPEGWEIKEISEMYETSSGGTPSRKKAAFYQDGMNSWVKTKELNDSFIIETEEKITDEAINKSSAKLFPAQTVLIAMYGATIGRLGILSKNAATNQACCAFLQKNGHHYSPFYIFSFLLDKRKDIIALGMGAAQQNISQTVLKKLKIIAPTNHILKAYDDIMSPIFTNILNLTSQNERLNETRDLLINKLIN